MRELRLPHHRLLAALLVIALPVTWAALADEQQTPDAPTGEWLENVPSPTGRWVTPTHDAVIQISQCGTQLCGQIVGIVLPPGEPVPKDWEGQSQCGLTIIHVAPAGDGANSQVWNGSITDPRDGSVYHAKLRLDSADDLLLRGYVGIPLLGQTQTWTKYAGPMVPVNCRLSG